MKNPQFDLPKFSATAELRSEESFNINVSTTAPTYFGASLAEEAGEVAGILKKLERPFSQRDLIKLKEKHIKAWEKAHKDTPHQYDLVSFEEWEKIHKWDLIKKLALECADTFSYLDLICTKFNIDLFHNVKLKFNQVSDALKSTLKIENINVDKNQEESH